MREKLRVIISLDVEEEGLFSGHYARRDPSVKNVACIKRLIPLSQDLRLPLTLLCSHAVFTDKESLSVLDETRNRAQVEIGAHLHHWNTPPLIESNDGPPERTHKLPEGLVRKKLETLLNAGRRFAGEDLVSFRMGRWDLKAKLLPLLSELGVQVDSSICPLRAFIGGADHFLAPADPYWHQFDNGGRILEAPITQVPIFSTLAKSWRKMWASSPKVLDSFHFFGAMSANPLWHSALVMRQAVRSHVKAGGKLINLFLHSSELMPGASPHIPDQAAADRLIKKLTSFCHWLFENYSCEGITMKRLPSFAEKAGASIIHASPDRDW